MQISKLDEASRAFYQSMADELGITLEEFLKDDM